MISFIATLTLALIAFTAKCSCTSACCRSWATCCCICVGFPSPKDSKFSTWFQSAAPNLLLQVLHIIPPNYLAPNPAHPLPVKLTCKPRIYRYRTVIKSPGYVQPRSASGLVTSA